MNPRKLSTQKELIGNNPQQVLSAEELTTTNHLYPFNSTRQEIEHKFKNHIQEELKLGSVVSYVENKTVPLLRSYRYKEAFAFVMDFLRRFEADSYVHLDWQVEHYVKVMTIHNTKDLLNEGGGK
ncbi:MAG: hypothetical protein KAT65_22675 [Methanophagales archaeon]|jgi:hypothetical protein|nr:hypothetical protein [Methanophagales archaeon]